MNTTNDTFTCETCGELFAGNGNGKRFCSDCAIKRHYQLCKVYRDNRRKRQGKLTREESTQIAVRIVEQYLRETGLKTIIYSKYIYYWGTDRGLFPDDWSYQKTMKFLSFAIPRCYTYKWIGEKQYGLG